MISNILNPVFCKWTSYFFNIWIYIHIFLYLSKHTAAVGWQGLKIWDIIEGRKAPYRIDRNGTPIGWAPASSLRAKSGGKIVIGIVVIVASG